MRVLSGDYRTIAELGRGRSGTVLLAEHVGHGRRVVIRVLTPADAQQRDALARLRRELAAIALLAGPNVAAVYECEQAQDGRLYVVTECLEGATVAGRLLEDGPFPLPDVMEIAGQCARILHIGQQLGIRNRGLRLDSVFLTRPARGGWQVKLRDFGLPVAMDPSLLAGRSGDAGDLTDASDPAAPGSDVSSLGLAVYAMLTGDPWPARTGSPLRSIITIRSDVPPALDEMLRASLDPAGCVSYQSATEFWSALRDATIEAADRPSDAPATLARPARAAGFWGPTADTDPDGAARPDVPSGPAAPFARLGVGDSGPGVDGCHAHRRAYRLGDLLVETNNITEEQLAIALLAQQASGRRLGEVLVQLDYLSDRGMRQALCKQLGIGFLDLDGVSLDRAMARLIPVEFARRHRVLPVAREGNRLRVAVEDPTNDAILAELRQQTGCDIDLVTAEYASFWRAFSTLYDADPADRPAPEPDSPRRAAMPGRALPSGSGPPAGGCGRRVAAEEARRAEREVVSVQQEDLEVTLTRLQSRYAALLQEHEAAVEALQKQEEHYASLLRERQDIAEGIERLAQQFRS